MNAPVFAAFAPGVLGCRQNRFGDLVQKCNILGREFAERRLRAAERSPARQAANRPLPPTNATPPSKALTRRIASRRLIELSGSVSEGVHSWMSIQRLRRLSSFTAKAAARAVIAM